MSRHTITLSGLLCFLTLSVLSASDLSLEGTVGYDIHSGTVELSAGRVSNNSNNAHSGTIQWSLWATSNRYSGGSISGYILGEYEFSDVLDGGYYYNNPTVTTNYDAPPDGTYYITMTLSEWTGSDYVIRDYHTFDDSQTFGDGGSSNDGGGAGAPLPGSSPLGNNWYYSSLFESYVDMGGDWCWSPWFGFFYANVNSSTIWIYSIDLEWAYLPSTASAANNWWCWLVDQGWCFTTDSNFPDVFLSEIGSWCRYDSSLGDFYNYDTGKYLDNSDGGGGIGGGTFTVDYIITNTGGLDAASWSQFVETASSALEQTGYTNFYQYSYTSNEFILRYDMESADAAAQLRSGLQSLVGDYGGFRIDVR